MMGRVVGPNPYVLPPTDLVGCVSSVSALMLVGMSPAIRGRVRCGRLVVDALTDLPDVLEVTLAVVDDDLDAEERRALTESLDESYAQADRGELKDAGPVLAALRVPAR
jgi:hypothetical protein